MMQSVYRITINEEQVDQDHSTNSYFGRPKLFWDDFVRQISTSDNYFAYFKIFNNGPTRSQISVQNREREKDCPDCFKRAW